MENIKIYYRRNLPHYQPPDATFFVTSRLAGSLPEEVIARLKEEYEQKEKLLLKIKNEKERKQKLIVERKRYFVRFDELLDKATEGPHWLKDERVAEEVAEAIHFRDGKKYELIAYCIMPNHVHLVFYVGRNVISTKRSNASRYILAPILQSLKGYTAHKANKILNRTGAFWQHESYDHVVQDERELERVIAYVLNNPVKAGLVSTWQEWKWSYVQERFL